MNSGVADQEPVNTVLIVEDDPGARALISRVLGKGREISLREADTLARGLEEAEIHRPDVVVLDLSLPDSQSLATLVTFREAFVNLPCVVVTSNRDPNLGERLLEAGAQDFIFKDDLLEGNFFERLGFAVLRQRNLALEEELRQRQKMDSLGLLASGVAHDVNNQLGIVSAAAELGLGELPMNPEAAAVEFERILSTCERLGMLTTKILSFARRRISHPIPLDLGQALHSLRSEIEMLIEGTVELELEEGVFVEGDLDQITNAAVNLVVNSHQAMGKEGQLRVTLKAVSRPPPGHPWGLPWFREAAWLVFDDSGPGMSPELRKRALEPFFTTKPDGNGLGLATVYGVVQRLGGDLRLLDSPLGGARVSILLPRCGAPVVPDVLPPAQHVVGDPGTVLAGRRVLLVEDESALREIQTRILVRSGCEVAQALGFHSGLEEFRRRGPFDAIVSDIQLGDGEGTDLVRIFREEGFEGAMILTSGVEIPDSEKWVGPRLRFLQKPVRPRNLVATLAELLA